MDLSHFEGKKIALLGFGVENISVAKFFVKHGIDFQILDRLPVEELSEDAQEEIKSKKLDVKSGEDYLSNLEEYEIIVRSPGVPYLTPEIQTAKSSGAQITSSTKLFFDLCPAKIIGVTGTKGKGTTASIIARIIEQNIQETRNKKQTNSKFQIPNTKDSNFDTLISDFSQVYLVGNIGTPSFDIIDDISPEDLVVFELSSFQLQDLEKSPQIAVIVNLAEDHLDYHKTLEEYRQTKENILKYQSESDFAVLNYDYPASLNFKNIGKAKKLFFSKESKEVDARVENGCVFLGAEKICCKNEIKLIGDHNLENIAAASLVGKILQVPTSTIATAVKEFTGLPHRLEFVREVDGVKYFNDSFSTNPTPTIAAIRSFAEPIVLIVGGSEKGADFSELAEEIKASKVESVVAIGVEGSRIREAIENSGNSVKVVDGGDSIDSIVKTAKELAASGSVVLFSPACASFDMFKNYKDRGEKFKTAVSRLEVQNL